MYDARLEMAVRDHIVGVRIPLELWCRTGFAEDLADLFKGYSMDVWDIPESKIVLQEESVFMSELCERLNDLRLIVQNVREENHE